MIADKHRAESGKRRIAEASLLGWMTLGGAYGGLLASRLVRHKTRKQPFASQMMVRGLLWTAILILWWLGYLEPLATQGLAILCRFA
ncbi:MAG: DUF1294 domain-containing protein [Sphingopyxis sp.]|nr:DUF1294 domain-containing protein [Sphingopyxis sp.]